jgi:secondary thiamine-phosphate synthase enzyme
MVELKISTGRQIELIDITAQVQDAVTDSKIKEGACIVFVPHTTAAVTINEGADPAVKRDIISELDKIIPLHDNYAHREGNSAAHIKATLTGSSETILVENGRLVLGTWQSIYFCEFDGPRSRKVHIRLLPA